MPVTINKRATWATYVVGALYERAAADPVPSAGPWNPVGGVFIHHRGPAAPGANFDTEEDCRRDIATVRAG